jgi:allantoicase
MTGQARSPTGPAPRDPASPEPIGLDLASRAVGGVVLAASDEFFAVKENLISPTVPGFRPATFGPHGQEYDGWETRRRRTPGHDWAIVLLGAPGVITSVVVDTAHFTGNNPARCAVDATATDGYPPPDALTGWTTVVPETDLGPDARHAFPVTDPHRYTHVRLRIMPDGGVARLHVHGTPLPDPRELAAGPVDLLAAALGGHPLACSDDFYSHPANLLLPDPAATMGEGWETRRRRAPGNDWVELALGLAGIPRLVEVDTRHFLGNAPGTVVLTALDDGGVLLPETPLLPNTRHRFVLPPGPPCARVRLDIIPDGGLARLRLYGTPTASALAEATRRWYRSLPPSHAAALHAAAGLAAPAGDRAEVPPAIQRLVTPD